CCGNTAAAGPGSRKRSHAPPPGRFRSDRVAGEVHPSDLFFLPRRAPLMKIDKAGWPFIAGALVPAAVLAVARRYGWATSFGALGAFMTYFFRAPERRVPAGDGLIVAPADGRVMIAGPSDHRWAPDGDWLQVTIFLSPLDVHINRAPNEGRVTRVEYRPGQFLPAYREDASQN